MICFNFKYGNLKKKEKAKEEAKKETMEQLVTDINQFPSLSETCQSLCIRCNAYISPMVIHDKMKLAL